MGNDTNYNWSVLIHLGLYGSTLLCGPFSKWPQFENNNKNKEHTILHCYWSIFQCNLFLGSGEITQIRIEVFSLILLLYFTVHILLLYFSVHILLLHFTVHILLLYFTVHILLLLKHFRHIHLG